MSVVTPEELIASECANKSLAEALSDKNEAISAYSKYVLFVQPFINVPERHIGKYKEVIQQLSDAISALQE